MRQLIRSFAVALLLSPAALAQPFFFSEPTPLTTTRYVAYDAHRPRLISNGVLPYLLWTRDGKVRITPVTSVRRVGRPVLDASLADAVWTGSHFLVVGYQSPNYVGRLVGADGEPIGEPFTVVANAPAGRVNLAFDGARVLLLFGGGPERSVLLSRDGVPITAPQDAPTELQGARLVATTARSGELVLAVSRRSDVVLARLVNGTQWIIETQPVPERDLRDIATAASQNDSLTIWTNGIDPMTARKGDGDAITLAGTAGAAAVDVVWDGRDYIYAYRIGSRLYFRYFNTALPFASVDVAPTSDTALSAVGGQTYAAFSASGGATPIVVRDVLTLAGDAGAFGAANQWTPVSASSATSALFTWFESPNALYAGVRTASGAWYERQIPNQDDDAPLAASDGNGFVIIHATPSGSPFGGPPPAWTATLLDAQGNLIGNGPRVAFYPEAITWAGDAYVVVGVDSFQRLVATRLSLSGTVTPPTVIALGRMGRTVATAGIAARNGELLVVWVDYDNAASADILGARFTPDLQTIDTQRMLLAERGAVDPDVVWDGTRYVIAWRNISDGTVQYRTLRANAAVSGISTLPVGTNLTPRLTLIPGGVAINANHGNVVFLRDGAETLMTLGNTELDAVATIGSRVAFVQPLARDEMPYHGATRLNIRIGDLVAPAPKPSAPTITRADLPTGGAAMIITWNAPPEPVNGYRVEYRVDDGVWNELDTWFDARTRELAIRPWRSDPVRYQFRVRAVNDAGFGPYSAAVTVRTRKIRSVR
jgi:hypothetical protein